MALYSGNLSVQESMSALDGNINLRGICLAQDFSPQGDSPTGYIRTVKKELAERGEIYSSSELKVMHEGLKEAYAKCKYLKDKVLLSEYRSSLARIGRLLSFSEVVENKSLDEILESKENDTYHTLVSARTWLLRQNYSQKCSSVEKTYEKVHALLEEKAEEGEALTAGEQKAYTNLIEELESIESNMDKIIPFETKRKAVKEPETIPPIPICGGKTTLQKIGTGLSRAVIGLTFLLGIGAAAISSFQSEQPYYSSVPKVQASVITPHHYSQNSFPDLVQKPVLLPQFMEIKPEIALPGTHIVKERDILWDLAERYYGDPLRWTELAQANGIEDPRELQIGEVLTLDCKIKKEEKT